MLVVSAHAADFVWRAGGAIALAAARVLGAGIEFLDAGDYPLREWGELVDRIVGCTGR